jgi:hypothetical protein
MILILIEKILINWETALHLTCHLVSRPLLCNSVTKVLGRKPWLLETPTASARTCRVHILLGCQWECAHSRMPSVSQTLQKASSECRGAGHSTLADLGPVWDCHISPPRTIAANTNIFTVCDFQRWSTWHCALSLGRISFELYRFSSCFDVFCFNASMLSLSSGSSYVCFCLHFPTEMSLLPLCTLPVPQFQAAQYELTLGEKIIRQRSCIFCIPKLEQCPITK